jgi:hypothetical protein
MAKNAKNRPKQPKMDKSGILQATYLTIPCIFLHIPKCGIVENIIAYNLMTSSSAQKNPSSRRKIRVSGFFRIRPQVTVNQYILILSLGQNGP